MYVSVAQFLPRRSLHQRDASLSQTAGTHNVVPGRHDLRHEGVVENALPCGYTLQQHNKNLEFHGHLRYGAMEIWCDVQLFSRKRQPYTNKQTNKQTNGHETRHETLLAGPTHLEHIILSQH